MQRYFSNTTFSKGQSVGDEGFAYKQLRLLGISDVTARTVQHQLKQRSYELSSLICTRGQHVEGWSFIINGIVGVSIPTDDGGIVSLGVFGPGVWIGEHSILTGHASLVDYVCLTDVDIITLPTPVVETLLISVPAFAQYMSHLMANRLQSGSEVLALQKIGKPTAKVVIGLAQLGDTLAMAPENGSQENISIPFSQGLIASLCGVSRTVFSGIVRQLEKREWLSLTYSSIELIDISRWKSFIELYRMNFQISFVNSVDEILNEVEHQMAQRFHVSRSSTVL